MSCAGITGNNERDRMSPSEARRMKKKLQEQYQRDIEAIDRVLELSLRRKRDGTPSPRYIPRLELAGNVTVNTLIQDVPTSEAPVEHFGHANTEFEDSILEIIRGQVPADFKIKDVMEAVVQRRPEMIGRRSTISFALSGLVARGRAVVVQQGRGRRPGIYRLV